MFQDHPPLGAPWQAAGLKRSRGGDVAEPRFARGFMGLGMIETGSPCSSVHGGDAGHGEASGAIIPPEVLLSAAALEQAVALQRGRPSSSGWRYIYIYIHIAICMCSCLFLFVRAQICKLYLCVYIFI